ncbi:MAG: glycogen-binding domain-containing protein [Gemmatimonadota bacterium]|nr:MAG: glycogen-binding domain-containing protein [Gemmatimonadota bacterium]
MVLGLLASGHAPSDLHAQEARLYLDAGVSHARPPAGVEIDPSTYALFGGRLLLGSAFGSLYGGLALSSDAADWLGGALGASFAASLASAVNLSLGGSLSAFTMGEPTRYDAISGRLVPEARFAAGQAWLAVRGYAGLGRSEVTDRSVEPPTPLVADLWMYGGGLELAYRLGAAQVWTGAEAFESAAGAYYDGYAGSSGRLGPTRWQLGLRFWDTPGDTELEFELSLSVPLRASWSLEVAGGRSGPDPLLNSPAGVDGSLVLVWNPLRAGGAAPPLYTVTGGEHPVVLFRLDDLDADAVSVIGDFSSWEPVAMRRQGKAWFAQVPVEPGLYHFGFLVDGEWYLPDQAPGKINDDFGRLNATLVVTAR